jgi:hypothetical protein
MAFVAPMLQHAKYVGNGCTPARFGTWEKVHYLDTASTPPMNFNRTFFKRNINQSCQASCESPEFGDSFNLVT